MPKIIRGRLAGFHGMTAYSADELNAWATAFNRHARRSDSPDDPLWLRRWSIRLRRLAEQKEKAREHKGRQKQPPPSPSRGPTS